MDITAIIVTPVISRMGLLKVINNYYLFTYLISTILKLTLHANVRYATQFVSEILGLKEILYRARLKAETQHTESISNRSYILEYM